MDPVAQKLARAWEQIRIGSFEAPQRMLREVARDGAPALQAEANYALGYLWQSHPTRSDLEKASGFYSRVASEYPDTPAAPFAILALARLEDVPKIESRRNVKAARMGYRRIMENYPRSLPAQEAAYRLGHTYTDQIGNVEAENEGIRILRAWLERRPDNVLGAAMQMTIGSVYVRRRQWRQAVDELVQADKLDAALEKRLGDRTLSKNKRTELYWQIARISEKELKDYALSETYYLKIVEDIQRVNKVYVARRSAQRVAKLKQQEETQ